MIDKNLKSVILKGVKLPLSSNIISGLAQKLIVKAIKKTIQIGMGILQN